MKKCCFYVFLALLVLLGVFLLFWIPEPMASDCQSVAGTFEGCWQYSYSPYHPNEKGIFGPVLQQSGTMTCNADRCEDLANGLKMDCRQEGSVVLCGGVWKDGRFGGFTAELDGDALTNSDIFVAERIQ